LAKSEGHSLSVTSFYILPRPKKFLHAEVSPENISI